MHIETQSWSAVSAVNFNDVFTSAYRNYLINVEVTAMSTANRIDMRHRIGGSDYSGTNYRGYNANVLGVTEVFTDGNAQSSAYITDSSSTSFMGHIWVMRPNLAVPTIMTFQGVTTSAGDRRGIRGINRNSETTQYDGFTLLVASGNFTGQARVYGYKD